jgi:hypothetical protein
MMQVSSSGLKLFMQPAHNNESDTWRGNGAHIDTPDILQLRRRQIGVSEIAQYYWLLNSV